MNIAIVEDRGDYRCTVLRVAEAGEVFVVEIPSQSDRSDALRELLAAAETLANPRTPLAALLNGALQVAYTLETEAAQ